MLESDILYTAADNLAKLSGARVVASYEPTPPWDGIVSIRKNGHTDTLKVEIKKEVHQSNLPDLLPQLKSDGILVARYISKPGKKLLEENRINYLDLAGNCHIETSTGIFFHIKGEKNEQATKAKKHRAFNKNGIKLIYALLLDSELLNTSYRKMADKARISLGTVGNILNDLEENQFLVQLNKTERALHNKRELLRHWVTAFNQTLKPKLFRNRYRFINSKVAISWKAIQLGEHAFWGGEPAADYYTNYLIPEIWTLYTGCSRQQIIKEFQLVPAPADGNVEVYEIFWNQAEDIFVDRQNRMVCPLLVYAELLGAENSRNIEVAKRIYEKYLKDIIE